MENRTQSTGVIADLVQGSIGKTKVITTKAKNTINKRKREANKLSGATQLILV